MIEALVGDGTTYFTAIICTISVAFGMASRDMSLIVGALAVPGIMFLANATVFLRTIAEILEKAQ